MDFNTERKLDNGIDPNLITNSGMAKPVDPAKNFLMTVMTADSHLIDMAIRKAKRDFHPQVKELDSAVTFAKNHVVDSEESLEIAVSNAGAIKKLLKTLNLKREEVIASTNTFTRGINGFIKVFKDKGDAAVSEYNRNVSTYTAKIEAESRAREARARKEAEKLKKQIEEDAKAKGYEAPQVEVIPMEEKRDTVIRTESGASAHTRKVWTFKIIKLSDVPIEYLMLDEKKVNGVIKAGIRSIPGLDIFQKGTTVFR